MKTRRLVTIAGAAWMLAVSGCADREATWSAESAEHSVYATQIPLYPRAMVEEVMGSNSYGETPGFSSEGMTWSFVVNDPKDKVVAWYEARLPQAKKIVQESGDVTFSFEPKGAEPDEEVGVTIQDGRLVVHERTRAGKHRNT
jgi:hypothetical protein